MYLTISTYVWVVLAVTLNPNLAQHGIESDDVTTNLELPPAEELLPAEELPPAEEVMKSPIMATSYTVASLQSATNNFSQEFLIGEGSFGRVYKAEFPNRKVVTFSFSVHTNHVRFEILVKKATRFVPVGNGSGS